MFRSMSSEKHFSSGESQSRNSSLEEARAESSWVSMFFTVSKPAWSLLQRYLPGRGAQTPAHWRPESGQSDGLDKGTSLHRLMPDPPGSARLNVAYVRCQHENATFLSPGDGESLSWLTADSLVELGIQKSAGVDFETKQQPPGGYLTAARNSLSQVLLNAAAAQKDSRSSGRQSELWYSEPAATRYSSTSTSSWWWDGLWGTGDGPENVVSKSSQTRTSSDTEWPHCEERHSSSHCQERGSGVAGDGVHSMLRESTGPSCFKEPADNEGLHMPRPESLPSSEQLPSVHQHSVIGPRFSARAVAACSEVAVLTPDQDNGYSSLEEENANTKNLNMKLAGETQGQSDSDASAASQGSDAGSQGDRGEGEENPPCEEVKSKEEEPKEEDSESACADEALPSSSTPQCRNKAIAYIMGSPCSDESDSDNDSDSDDDDGFDSEGSSHFSDSDDLDDSDEGDEDEEDSEADELDSESERLWNSLCQNRDPYNPRNFTAPIRTAPNPSAAAVDSPLSGSPAESEHSPFSSPSPLVPQEESSGEETCSLDETENLRLWNSFSCSSDPYNPLNFQAPVRTREVARGRCKKGSPVGPPVYKKEEAEERLDSGFSETAPELGLGGSRSVRLKKVSVHTLANYGQNS